jgi:hypothetical protein
MCDMDKERARTGYGQRAVVVWWVLVGRGPECNTPHRAGLARELPEPEPNIVTVGNVFSLPAFRKSSLMNSLWYVKGNSLQITEVVKNA